MSKVSKRLPISCEPCRGRKIRCPRNGTPCETCLRRGIPRSECIYLRESAVTVTAVHTPIPPTAPTGHDELLARISALEDMLRRPSSGKLNSDTLQNGSASLLSPPLQNYYPDTASVSALPSPSDTVLSTRPLGALVTSKTGHVRYQPRASQWNSTMHNNSSSPPNDESNDFDTANDGNFPYELDAAVYQQDPCSLLPPMQQCNTLKSVYFSVFSPVSKSDRPLVEITCAKYQQSSSTSFTTLPSTPSMHASRQMPNQYHCHGWHCSTLFSASQSPQWTTVSCSTTLVDKDLTLRIPHTSPPGTGQRL